MNDLAVKKIAEVSAFITLGGDMLNRAGSEFATTAAEVHAGLQKVQSSTPAGFIPQEKCELFDGKVSRTTDKLTRMMELYIGDDWDNPTEVLEWSSFYAGAAAAHCAIAAAAAARSGADDAATTLDRLQADFGALLNEVITALARRGAGS